MSKDLLPILVAMDVPLFVEAHLSAKLIHRRLLVYYFVVYHRHRNNHLPHARCCTLLNVF